MTVDSADVTVLPYVDILRELRRVESLSTAERVAWKNSIIEEPEQLAGIFERSIEQVESAIGAKEKSTSFNDSETKKGPKPPPKPAKTKSARAKAAAARGPKTDNEKAEEILFAVAEAGGVTVSGAPRLAADYAGYRIAPLRTKSGSVLEGDDAPAGDPGERYRLDLLLQSRDEDALPIIGLLKYGEETDPLLALLEALAHVALLAAPGQTTRLRKQLVVKDEDGETPRFDDHDDSVFDIYLFVAGHRRNAASQRSALWDAVPAIIDAVLDQPEIAKHVRRIEGVKIPLSGDARPQLAGASVLGTPVAWEKD